MLNGVKQSIFYPIYKEINSTHSSLILELNLSSYRMEISKEKQKKEDDVSIFCYLNGVAKGEL